MKKASYLFCLSIVTAILCGIWSAIATVIGLIGWAGFAGCTTYFASGEHGFQGIKKSLIPNLIGVICGMSIIGLGNIVPLFDKMGIWCAIITFVMCIISKFRLFAFCPGTFMGCFVTFAAGGDWLLLVPSLILGVCLGAGCEYGGSWLYQVMTNAESKEK